MLSRIFFLAMSCLVFSAQASRLPPAARGVIVTTPGLSGAAAKAYALTHDKLLLSDYLEASRPGEDHDRQLKQHFEKAQRAWLGGETESARTEFRALSELSLKADWRNPQREVLQTADLRLAQTSESGTEREGWLETAARLYGDLAPNAGLFPPPLLVEYEIVKRRLSTTMTEIDLRDVFPDFQYVIVDGRKLEITTENRLALTSGLHRLTAYSDSHEAVTEFLTAAQLRVLRLSPPPLTVGVCSNAKLRDRADLPSSVGLEIYSGDQCPHDIANLLRGSRLISEPEAGRSTPLDFSEPKSTAAAKSHTWLWVAGGVLLAGAGYALATRHESSPEPVHRSGF